MDDKNKSIIDKILKIAGVEACAISSLDGEVLKYDTSVDEITVEQINKVSSEISKLFSSYSISSNEISSLYLNFNDRNIIVYGFGSGFIFILSQRNSNVNLLKMETSYLENEFRNIVSQSLGNIGASSFISTGSNTEANNNAKFDRSNQSKSDSKSEDAFNSLFSGDAGGTIGGEAKASQTVSKNTLDAIKDAFSSILGPISQMLFDAKIKELNESLDNFNAENLDNLINILSDEIENKKDKINFISSTKKIINS